MKSVLRVLCPAPSSDSDNDSGHSASQPSVRHMRYPSRTAPGCSPQCRNPCRGWAGSVVHWFSEDRHQALGKITTVAAKRQVVTCAQAMTKTRITRPDHSLYTQRWQPHTVSENLIVQKQLICLGTPAQTSCHSIKRSGSAPALERDMKFTHFEECRWNTVCCFVGLLFVVALFLLWINFRLLCWPN